MRIKAKFNKSTGSVLVYTLILMFMFLSVAIGMITVTAIERKSGGATGKTTVAFQVADTGAERVLDKIRKAPSDRTLAALFGADCSIINNVATVSGSVTGGNYTVTFLDDGNPPQSLNDCSFAVSAITDVKSVGMYAGTSRAVQIAVAADYWTLGTTSPYTTSINNTNAGNIGIGTTAPTAKLHVVGPAVIPGLIGQIQTVSPTADTTTSSTSFGDMNGMSITLTTRANSKLFVTWNAGIYQPTIGAWVATQATLDGSSIGAPQGGAYTAAGSTVDSMGGNAVGTAITAGSHTVKIQWKVSGGTAYSNPTVSAGWYGRTLTVMEIYQ